jgi:hypothetical protein
MLTAHLYQTSSCTAAMRGELFFYAGLAFPCHLACRTLSSSHNT